MMQAPIVETANETWTGYNPAKLKEHGLDYKTRQQRGNGPDTGQGYGR